MKIGKKLRTARMVAGLTQEAAARGVGVTRQTVFNWENDRSYPDAVSMIRLSRLYGISCEELMGEKMDPLRWLTIK